VIVPVRSRAAAGSTVSAATSVKSRLIRGAARPRVPSFQPSDVLVASSG
jgi:hypothetical protein